MIERIGKPAGDNRRRALFLFPTDRMGGAEQVTRTVAKQAALCGMFDDVRCLILSRSNTGTLGELMALPNVTLHYTEASSERRGLLAFIHALMKDRFDFVFSSHTHINALCSVMRRLGMLRAGRLVTRESTLSFEREFGFKGPLIRAFYWLYGAQDLIVCQTRRMQQSLNMNTRNRFATKSAVVPNPIELDRIELAGREPTSILDSIPPRAMKIVWCGRLIPVKAPTRAIETLRAIHDLGQKDAHLIMIGDGPLMAEIRDAVHRLELDGLVTLCGYQPNPLAIMSRCDLGLLTSDMEGFPNVILEMLAAGVKGVVTTDCAGDLKDMPGVSVVTVPSAAALAESMTRIRKLRRPPALPSYLESRSPRHFLRMIGT